MQSFRAPRRHLPFSFVQAMVVSINILVSASCAASMCRSNSAFGIVREIPVVVQILIRLRLYAAQCCLVLFVLVHDRCSSWYWCLAHRVVAPHALEILFLPCRLHELNELLLMLLGPALKDHFLFYFHPLLQSARLSTIRGPYHISFPCASSPHFHPPHSFQ